MFNYKKNKIFLKEFQIIKDNNYSLNEYLNYQRDSKIQFSKSLRLEIYHSYALYSLKSNKSRFII